MLAITRLTSLIGATILWFLVPAAMAFPASNASQLPITIGQSAVTSSVTVRRGDHLWKISKDHLTTTWDRPVPNRDVTPYWRRVVAVNRDRIKSGDPDLIYPGETILLPAVTNESQ